MLVKCKICKTEYNFHEAEVTSSGVELKCSACGHIWVELPDHAKYDQSSLEELSEDQIVEPSILSGKTYEEVVGDTSKDFSISDLAKQELLVQKGTNQEPTIDPYTERRDYESRDRKFEWLTPETGKASDKSVRQAKSFEILTQPPDTHNDSTEHKDLANLTHASDPLSVSASSDSEELINPKLVQRIKGIEKIQTNEHDHKEEPLAEHVKASKIRYIVIITSIIAMSLYIGIIFQNIIIDVFPPLEPIISFLGEKLGLLLRIFKDFLPLFS